MSIPTYLALSPSANPAGDVSGYNTITYTATVTINYGSAPLRSMGSVTFQQGYATISGCTSVAVNSSGQATCTTTYTTSGMYSISAYFNPPSGFQASNNSGLTEQIDPPISLSSAFSPSTIAAGATTSLAVTVSNTGPGALSSISFTDAFPSSLKATSGSGTCSGSSVTVTGGGSGVSVNLGPLSGNSSCTISLNLISSAAATISNTTSGATSTQAGTGTGATAALTVTLPAPTIVFAVPTHHTIDAAFTVAATSNSSGAITYSLLGGPASLTGSVVTLTGTAGTVQLRASQAANGNYVGGTQTVSFSVVAGSVWLGNPGGSLSVFGSDGAGLLNATGGGVGTIGGPQTEAFDASGNLWVASANGVSEFGPAGAALTSSAITAGGISNPVSLAVDGAGFIWSVNGDSTVSVLTNAGVAVASTSYPATAAGSTPGALMIDLSGSVWVTNTTANTVTEIVGVATPVSPPATALANGTTGVAP